MPQEHTSKEKHTKKHKKEKSKKRKKEKKEKKHKKNKSKSKNCSSSSTSSLGSDREEIMEWEEREPPKQQEWSFLDRVLNYSVTVKDKKPKSTNNDILDRPGQSDRELNPYWKDGGDGLPPVKPTDSRGSKQYFSSHSSGSSQHDYLSDRRINKDDDDSGRKTSRLNFLKPGEDNHFAAKRNSYQRNWKKKDSKSEETKPVEEKNSQLEDKKVKEETSSLKPLFNEDLNKLAAKLVKAEIMGNKAMIEKLKAQLDAAKNNRSQNPGVDSESGQKSMEVLILTDSKGFKKSADDRQGQRSSKKQKVNTHNAKERVSYFPDDDKYSLKNLFEKEKASQEDEDELFYISKLRGKTAEELDDAYLEAASSHKLQQKSEDRKNQKSMKEALVKHKTLQGCRWCIDNRNQTKHLIVSTGSKSYLCLPEETSLNEGHCIIVPLSHETSARHLDEDVWEEIKTYQRTLTKMFSEQGQDVIFFESARAFKHYPHCYIQCVPMEKEVGDLAPIYFQKALSESETEWSNNKKVIDFRNKDLRRSIPKGLPYFAVSFGNEGGFAHIIEDEILFPRNFAEEVIGGMMDLDTKKWRKPQKENFRSQRDKALAFFKLWKKYEFNENCGDSGSDSDSSSS